MQASIARLDATTFDIQATVIASAHSVITLAKYPLLSTRAVDIRYAYARCMSECSFVSLHWETMDAE